MGTAGADGSGFVASQVTNTDYDALNRRTGERLSMGGRVYAAQQFGYDAANRLRCVAQRMNKAQLASTATNACGVGPEGSDGPDRVTSYEYTNADEPWKVNSAIGTALAQATQVMDYDASKGELAGVTDARGNRTVYSYDG